MLWMYMVVKWGINFIKKSKISFYYRQKWWLVWRFMSILMLWSMSLEKREEQLVIVLKNYFEREKKLGKSILDEL